MDVSGYFLGLSHETLEELDDEVRKFAILLDHERLMRANALNPNDYEELRFISRDFYDAIVIEAHCEKCDRYIPIVVKYLEYTNLAKKVAGRSIILANSKCPNCHTNESMIIPSFI